MDLYPWLKVLHILPAVVAVGFNMSYAIWLARAAREPTHMSWTLRGIKTLDDRFANPAYGLLFLLGVAMVLMRWQFTQPWIAISIGLYLVAVLMGLLVYSPLLRRQLAVLEASGPEAAEFQSLSSRARSVGIALGAVVVVIIGLMVLKPGA
ncbi:MAG: DUF2269 domain-containing protein [Chloroflexota bacterium]|nr:DUF2269 domain-containing protein [Chloroflexota bacterium]